MKSQWLLPFRAPVQVPSDNFGCLRTCWNCLIVRGDQGSTFPELAHALDSLGIPLTLQRTSAMFCCFCSCVNWLNRNLMYRDDPGDVQALLLVFLWISWIRGFGCESPARWWRSFQTTTGFCLGDGLWIYIGYVWLCLVSVLRSIHILYIIIWFLYPIRDFCASIHTTILVYAWPTPHWKPNALRVRRMRRPEAKHCDGKLGAAHWCQAFHAS